MGYARGRIPYAGGGAKRVGTVEVEEARHGVADVGACQSRKLEEMDPRLDCESLEAPEWAEAVIRVLCELVHRCGPCLWSSPVDSSTAMMQACLGSLYLLINVGYWPALTRR